MQTIKTVICSCLIGGVITTVSYRLGSNFLHKFLMEDLLTVLIALLAINSATLGFIFSELEKIAISIHEITGTRPKFLRTQQEAMLSIKEQMWMIGLTLCVSIVCSSSYCEEYCVLKYVSEGILTSILIFALYILYDTSQAVFTILDASAQLSNK